MRVHSDRRGRREFECKLRGVKNLSVGRRKNAPLFLQPHSFGTFARADPDDAAAPLLPERMTYNSITSIQKFVCDGDDPSYAGVQCGGDGAGTCALSHSGFTDTMDWCWTDTNQNDWCWCIESGGEGVYTQAHLDAAKKEGYDEGYAAGVASVDITSDNQAAFDEGVASVDLSEYKTISEIGNYGITVADVIPSDPRHPVGRLPAQVGGVSTGVFPHEPPPVSSSLRSGPWSSRDRPPEIRVSRAGAVRVHRRHLGTQFLPP